MSNINKNRKTKKGKMFPRIFLGFVLIYLIFRALPSSYSNARTLMPKKEELVDTIETKGILIKKEIVYDASNDGIVENFVKEGSRVKSGTKIATLTSSNDSSAIEGELFQIEESLRELRDSKLEISNSNGDLNPKQLENKIIKEIQKSIKNDELEKIYILKEQLSTINKGELISEDQSEVDTLTMLENRRDSLTDAMNENLKQYYSESGGLISYKIDGYEKQYMPSDFEKYTYDKLVKEVTNVSKESELIEDKNGIKINNPIYKLIDNFEWYLAILVDDLKKIEEIKENNTLTININNDMENMTGRVVMINEFKNNGVIVLKFTSKLHDFYDLRFIDLEILKSNKNAYKIPKEAVIDKQNEKGVYIKDLSGVVRFRPVITIGEDNNNFYIKAGDDSGNLRLSDDKVIRTITNFDEVFLKPNNVREGSIIK